VLSANKVLEDTGAGNQVVAGAGLDQRSALQHEDAVAVLHRGEPVRDEHGGAVAEALALMLVSIR